MTRPEFNYVIKKLQERWPDIGKPWWLEEALEFCLETPQRAFEDWAKYQISNSRQLPLPGDFKRYWWDNQNKYEQKKEETRSGCAACCSTGYIWADKESSGQIYTCVFLCPECNAKKSKIPIWAREFEAKGYSKQELGKWTT